MREILYKRGEIWDLSVSKWVYEYKKVARYWKIVVGIINEIFLWKIELDPVVCL